MNKKKKSCIDCKKQSFTISKRCGYCYYKHKKNINKSKKYKIKQISRKQNNRLNVYYSKRVDYLLTHKNCEAMLVNCSIVSSEIHHKRGRIGDNLTDESMFLAVCRNCHNWIEEHPKEAKEMNFKVSRL